IGERILGKRYNSRVVAVLEYGKNPEARGKNEPHEAGTRIRTGATAPPADDLIADSGGAFCGLFGSAAGAALSPLMPPGRKLGNVPAAACDRSATAECPDFAEQSPVCGLLRHPYRLPLGAAPLPWARPSRPPHRPADGVAADRGGRRAT